MPERKRLRASGGAKGLSESSDLTEHDEDEAQLRQTIHKVGTAYADSSKTFGPTQEDVAMRAEEKDIPIGQARAELWKECRPDRESLTAEALKLMRPKLSKPVRQKLGIPAAGRPAGSKSQPPEWSKDELYRRLKGMIRSCNQKGVDLTQKRAAELLDYPNAKKLYRLLKSFGEERDWRTLVTDILIEKS